MKKCVALALAVVAGMTLLCGCVTMPVDLSNALIADVKLPGTVTELSVGSKTGSATAQNILGIIGQGDCSIEAAAKNGAIRKVATVDYKVKNILWGVFSEVTTVVTGD